MLSKNQIDRAAQRGNEALARSRNGVVGPLTERMAQMHVAREMNGDFEARMASEGYVQDSSGTWVKGK